MWLRALASAGGWRKSNRLLKGSKLARPGSGA
jgi:hypothetical protein